MKKNINLNLVNSQIHESAELNPSSHVIDSIIKENSKIYKDCWVVKSKMECDTFIGDGTKIDNSRLDSFSRTGKYNHLYHTELGRHTYTGQDTIIMHSTIGSFSSISWGVTIGGGEHDFNRFTSHSFLYNNYDKLNNNVIYYDRFKKSCEVGNDVWIGANATILRGVKVGNGAVIGANAVVTKDVPPYAIVAGNPATIVKFRFAKEIIQKLNELKWWNCEDEFIKDNINLFAEEPTGKNIEEIERKINSMRGCQK